MECSKKYCETLEWNYPEFDVVCSSRDQPPLNQCSGLNNYTTSLNFCSNAGVRLCTISDLEYGQGNGKGCGYDKKFTWSSTECTTSENEEGFVIFNSHSAQQKCVPTDSRYAASCCADTINSCVDGIKVIFQINKHLIESPTSVPSTTSVPIPPPTTSDRFDSNMPQPTSVPIPSPTTSDSNMPQPTSAPIPSPTTSDSNIPQPSSVPIPSPTTSDSNMPQPSSVPIPSPTTSDGNIPQPTSVPIPSPTISDSNMPQPSSVPIPSPTTSDSNMPQPTSVPIPSPTTSDSNIPQPTSVPIPPPTTSDSNLPQPSSVPIPSPTTSDGDKPYPSSVPTFSPTAKTNTVDVSSHISASSFTPTLINPVDLNVEMPPFDIGSKDARLNPFQRIIYNGGWVVGLLVACYGLLMCRQTMCKKNNRDRIAFDPDLDPLPHRFMDQTSGAGSSDRSSLLHSVDSDSDSDGEKFNRL